MVKTQQLSICSVNNSDVMGGPGGGSATEENF